MTPPSTFLVRPATEADTGALGRLGAALVAIHHGFDPARFIAPTDETQAGYAEFLREQLDREEVILLVAEEAGAVVGYAFAELAGHDWEYLRGPAGVLHDLLVDPNHRGGGVGRALLTEMLAVMTARGAPRVVLSTAHQNTGAQRLFAAFGFRPALIEMTRELGGPS